MAIPASRVRLPSEADYWCTTFALSLRKVRTQCLGIPEVWFNSRAIAMLIVRTYAFWKCNRRILIGTVSFGSMCMVAAIVVSQSISSQTTNSVFKSLNCPGSDSSLATAIEYLCLILYEIGMLGLNWIAFRRMKRHNPPGLLITTLYRDGVMYVAAILAFSVLNAVVSLATPVQYSDLLNSLVTFQEIIETCLADIRYLAALKWSCTVFLPRAFSLISGRQLDESKEIRLQPPSQNSMQQLKGPVGSVALWGPRAPVARISSL
ncbi:hypothetical protein JVT61DRAFT_942 [Boletus reticuloceps]|uniref:Uncharacterized protein n=1 Tax=Boletus reticuloceps TaxID=495285 RepID=A0A8I3ABV8_9AGAM|nr:hypothetical protein JVT61DRAFT_942 [Boletus reticuloceps]